MVCRFCGQQGTLRIDDELPKGKVLCICSECQECMVVTRKEASKLTFYDD